MVRAALEAAFNFNNMAQRVTFYIDGFNFYYGLKRTKSIDPDWKAFYWIDFVKLFSQFLGKDQVLEKVIYFTASPLDPNKSSRQSALLNANRILNPGKFEVVRGKYINKPIQCPSCSFTISRPEEKKTDVNLSVRMIGDCVMDKTDVIVLVSADSDLIPPIEFIQKNYKGKKISVYFPQSNYSNDIKDNLIHHKSSPVLLKFNKPKFTLSIMNDTVTVGNKTYRIPPCWK